MKIIETLKELVNYYNVTRGVGHTTVMMSGASWPAKNGTVILTPNQKMYEYIKNAWRLGNGATNVTLNNIQMLRGRLAPLVIDNAALHELFRESAEALEILEKENTILKQKNTILKQKLNQIKNIVI